MTAGLSIGEALARLPALSGPHEVTPLPGGLTNHNYRVRTATRDVVVRISSPATDLLAVDREAEWRNTRAAAAAGVAAPVVGYLAGQGVLVVEFLPGRTYAARDVAANLPRLASALRRLHGGPEFTSRFDMFEVQRRYLAVVRERGFRLPDGYDDLAEQMSAVEGALAQHPEPLVPCHNDLLAANVLDDGGELRIIDYEYSGMNEASFEIGNLVAESQVDAEGLAELVSAYYGAVDEQLLARAELWGLVGRYGWTLWGVIQAGVSDVSHDFWDFATERFDLAATLLTSPRLDSLVESAARQPRGMLQ